MKYVHNLLGNRLTKNFQKILSFPMINCNELKRSYARYGLYSRTARQTEFSKSLHLVILIFWYYIYNLISIVLMFYKQYWGDKNCHTQSTYSLWSILCEWARRSFGLEGSEEILLIFSQEPSPGSWFHVSSSHAYLSWTLFSWSLVIVW